MILPTKHELLELFEVEPTVLDSGVPREYNTLTFTARRGKSPETDRMSQSRSGALTAMAATGYHLRSRDHRRKALLDECWSPAMVTCGSGCGISSSPCPLPPGALNCDGSFRMTARSS
jgi:hypothetical protein